MNEIEKQVFNSISEEEQEKISGGDESESDTPPPIQKKLTTSPQPTPIGKSRHMIRYTWNFQPSKMSNAREKSRTNILKDSSTLKRNLKNKNDNYNL